MPLLQKDSDKRSKKNNTSSIQSFNIEPIAVQNKIFRSGFFGAVVQLTYALADGVVRVRVRV